MSKILVMGGSTFVGSYLAKHLIKIGHEVDILTRGIKKIDYSGYKNHICVDRINRNEMQKSLNGRIYEYVFDISAYTREDVKILLESIDKGSLKKYIFCSSGAVYEPTEELIKEDFNRGENVNWGKYGLDKKEAEDYIIDSNIPYTIFRPTYIYGIENNLYREGYFFDRINQGKVISVPYSNKVQTQFIYIDDLVKVFTSSMESNITKGIYNLTNPELITWDNLIEACGDVLGKPVIKKEVKSSDFEVRTYFPFRNVTYTLDITNLIEDGLYVPQITLDEGLRKTYEWYRKNKIVLEDKRMINIENVIRCL